MEKGLVLDLAAQSALRQDGRSVPAQDTRSDDVFALRRQAVEARLAQLLPSAHDTICQSIRHSLLAPAKRVRGVLALTATHALGREESAAHDAACAVEMVHAASLILDDLPSMDDAQTRRGLPTNHRIYGEATAILAAIGCLNEAYGVLAKSDAMSAEQKADIAATLSDAVGLDGLVKGQDDDLGKARADMGLSDLELMYARKTGALFAAAAECGAILAGRPQLRRVMRRFGYDLGTGFQVLDDVLDASATSESAGKTVSTDQNRKTFVNLMGARAAAAFGRKKIEDAVAAAEAASSVGRQGQFALFAARLASSFAEIIPELSSELSIRTA
jgi:geranylgeranyl diphosphate synthase type II